MPKEIKAMTVVLYSINNDPDERRLLENINFAEIDICRSIADLKNHLTISDEMRKIVILVINDQDEIARISKLIEWFHDLLIILVINQNCFTTNNNDVHKLRPRYITYKDGDFQDVAIVLRKIINHYCS